MLLSRISGKRLAAAMLAACLTPYLAGAPAYAAEEIAWPKRLIVSAPASGTPAGMIMASIARVIEKNTPIQRVIVQPIGGINNFAPMMEKGEVDIAIHSGADVLAHMAGLEKNRMGFMRTLLPTSTQAFVVLTTPDKGIHNLADLRGKVVYSRNPGNTMFDPVVKALLAGAGLAESDLKANLTKANNTVAVADVVEGRADALIMPAMTNVVMELRQAKDECLFITPADDQMAAVKGAMPPGFYFETLPAGSRSYGNTDEVKNAPMYRSALLVSEKMPKALAAELVKVIMEHRDEWVGVHGQAKDWGVMSLGLPPLHEGSREYFESRGLISEEQKAEQEKFSAMLNSGE